MAETAVPQGLDPEVRRREITVEADGVHLGRMHHRVEVRGFTIESDEGENLGGDDRHPHPLDYLAAGVATCVLTQMVRYGHMLRARLDGIRVRVRFDWSSEGSVMAGTIAARCHGMTSHVEVDSPEDPALIAALIHNARAGCYAEAAIAQPVPMEASARLNGEPLDLAAYSKRPPGRRGA